ncbi:MAG: hypothetical protein ACFFC7_30310 [Candidatus Hermodarchaeota archaeon]
MLKAFKSKDLEFFDDFVYDPQKKVYLSVFSAPLKQVKPSSLSLLALLLPLSLELVLYEQKANFIFYSMNQVELIERMKRAERYLSEIISSVQQVKGRNLKGFFPSGQVIPIRDKKFWNTGRKIYGLYEIPVSKEGQQLRNFLNWYLKIPQYQRDVKIIFSFLTPESLIATKKQEKHKNSGKKREMTLGIIEDKMKALEFRGIEVLAQVAGTTHLSERERNIEKAYSFVQENRFVSFYRDVDSENRLRCRYPCDDNLEFPIIHGIRSLSSILNQKLSQTPKMDTYAKINTQQSSFELTPVKAQNLPKSKQIGLAAIIRDGLNRQVIIDPSVSKITRLALFNLVLRPGHSSQELCLENPDGRLYGPWPLPNFSNYRVFAFRALKEGTHILLWLLIELKQEAQILAAEEAVEWELIKWTREQKVIQPIHLSELNKRLTFLLEQKLPAPMIEIREQF